MFICIECNQKTKEKQRVFVGKNWCRTCYDVESLRSFKEDSIKSNSPFAVRTRPPKYMLNPEDYKRYGYE